MLLLKSPKTTLRGGRFLAWKASSKVRKSMEVIFHLGGGGGGGGEAS